MQNTYNALKRAIDENAAATEKALEKIMQREDSDYGLIFDAERYSLLGGGKRVRPFLVNECASLLGGSKEASMPLACALEMIHTYSLIHDDLPCMDNDDFRRGKPSNHKKYGYANALLAGDALLTGAFSVVANADGLDDRAKVEAVRLLAAAAGEDGMIGGQVMDLEGESKPLGFETLLKLHALKTAALMECAVRLGALAAGYGAQSEQSNILAAYAKNIGVCFQVIDDILDRTSTAEQLGKPIGSDTESHKTTFLTFYTIEDAKKYAESLTAEAISAISVLDGSERLTDFACYLLERQN